MERLEEIRARVEKAKGYVKHKFVASGSGNECAVCGAPHGGDSATWVPDAPATPPATRLDQITERVKKVSGKDGFFYIPDFEEHAHEDVPYLLTELTALREENARLKGALEYGFRLVNDRKGEGDFSPAKFVAMADEALSPSPAQRET